MKWNALAVALGVAACGNVDGKAGIDAAGPVDATAGSDAGPAHRYRGTLDATTPVQFGGGPKGFCTYSITLKQLAVELTVQASGEVTAGAVSDLNVEAIVGTCSAGVIPPKIARYTLDSAKAAPGGTLLTFQADPANEPNVALTGVVGFGGTQARATLNFKRGGDTVDPVLDWQVVAPVDIAEVAADAPENATARR